MGQQSEHRCLACGGRFEVEEGGGFFFDLLHCDRCGSARAVSHEEMGDVHLGYVKGLSGPYAVARTEMDARIREEYPGEPMTRSEYESAVEGLLEPCACGGSFRYAAPPRCPNCASTRESWSESESLVMYD